VRRLALAAVLLALLAPASSDARRSAYAVVSGSAKAGVAQFDILAGGRLSSKRPAKVGPARGLTGITLTPNGRTAYVAFNSTNPDGGPTRLGQVLLQYGIDRATGKLARKRPFTVRSGLGPSGVVVAPNGAHAYAGNSSSNSISQYRVLPTGRLSPLSPASARSGQAPLDVAVSPNGRNLYAANANEGFRGITQYTIRPNGTLAPKSPWKVLANQPSNIALTPDGRSAYAAVAEGVEQLDVARTTGKLTPKTPGLLPVGVAPDGIAVTPNGRNVYVGSEAGIAQFSVDPTTEKLTPKLPPLVTVPGEPDLSVGDLEVTPDGRTLYVAGACCTKVFQFDISVFSGTLSPKVPLAVGSIDTPQVMAVAPDAPVAAFSATHSARTVRFNGARSYDGGGAIARFTWSFGDRSGLASGPPRPQHTYRRAGRYRVTLAVTSTSGCSFARRVSTGHTLLCSGAHARASHLVVVR
jgi:DNA-binding beta-propeller fold protein YncE